MKREELGGGFFVYTEGDDTFSGDSLLLADFARVRPGSRALDLCTGCGIIAFLLRRNGAGKVTAADISEAPLKLLAAAAAESGADVDILKADAGGLTPEDIRDFPKNGFPLITANPPYFKEGRSPVRRRNEIRSELTLSPERLFSAAARLLSQDGEFCFCHLESRRDELSEKLESSGLYVRRLRKVRHSPEREPYLFMAACGLSEPASVETDEVTVRGTDGGYSGYYAALTGFGD